MDTMEVLVSPPAGFNGTRSAAFPIRDKIESALDSGVPRIVIDFSGVEGTQGFVDELVGRIVVERGSSIINKLTFRHCSANMQAIVRFVLTDRAQQVRNKVHRSENHEDQ